MEAKNVRNYPALPQEIIDTIVHEIASQNLTPETLRACALVSKSFCFPCRRHLFSHIELVSDNLSQSRAARLVNILQNPDNVGLAASVRSFSLILDVPSHTNSPFLGSKTLGRRLHVSKMIALMLAERLRLYENNLIKVLNLLTQAPLTCFTLHGRRGVPDWGTEVRITKRSVFTACAVPSLTTLCLSNLANLDESLIVAIMHSNTLKELVLANVNLIICNGDANPDLKPITSQIERLALRHVAYTQILRTMGRPTLPTFPTPYPFVTFPRLCSLAISGPLLNIGAETLRQFMLGVSNTLETLELEEPHRQGYPIRFGQLTSLRNLKLLRNLVFPYRISSLRTISAFLCTVGRSLVKLESLTIRFNLEVLPEAHFYHTHSIPSWLELDEILTGSSFLDLRRVDFHVQFIVTTPTAPAHADWQPQIAIDVNRVLPRLSTHPSIHFQLNIHNELAPPFTSPFFSL